MIQLFGNCVSRLDRETHPKKKSGTTKTRKSESLSIDKLREYFTTNYNIEITITLRPKVRKCGVEEANLHMLTVLDKKIRDYAGKNKFRFYFNYELHKPYDETAFLHSHGIISFYCVGCYADFLRKVAALDKWLYRLQLKANWSRIASLDMKYPIKEGNVDRKVGSFKKWYNYIHDENKEGSQNNLLGFSYNFDDYLKFKPAIKIFRDKDLHLTWNNFFLTT